MKYEDEIEVRKHRRTLERDKPFVLLGNEIDGRLFCHSHFEFKSFEELKERLPKVLKTIKGEGEWAFDLYQVPDDYRIWRRYGYYRYPNRGKSILKHSYMNYSINAVVITEEMISLSGDYLFFENSISDPKKFIEVRQIEINWKSSNN